MLEHGLEEIELVGRALLDRHDLDPLGGKSRLQLVRPEARLSCRQLEEPGSKCRQGLGRREPIGGSHCESSSLLSHQSGHSHHEELVQIGREDGAELHALEERYLLVGHELEHARVELDP